MCIRDSAYTIDEVMQDEHVDIVYIATPVSYTHLVLATGRALSYVPSGAKDLHLDGYVTCNGAYVTVHGKVIHKVIFEDEELAALIAYMDAHGINYILESNDFCYVKDLKDPSYLHFMDNFQLPKDNFVQYKSLQQVHGCISKITLAFGNRSSLQKSEQLLRPHYQMSLHLSLIHI